MNCSKCGSTVVVGKGFCTQCGNAITPEASEPSRPHTRPSVNQRAADMGRTRFLPAGQTRHQPVRQVYRTDIVFAFDATGSMGRHMDNLRDTTIAFSRDLESNNIDSRFGLVEYRDLTHGEPIHNHGFARTPEEFRSWIAGLREHGGVDEPESAIDALSAALEMPFRDGATRIVTLITDASYHEPGENGRTMESVCQEFRSKKIVAYVIGPDLPGYLLLTESMGGMLFNLESDAAGFRRIVKSLGKSISETVPRMTDVRAAADAALGRTRVR